MIFNSRKVKLSQIYVEKSFMFGLLISTFVAFSLTLGLANLSLAEEAVVPTADSAALIDKYKECDGKLKEELAELIKKDKDGILSLQYKLAILKLAKKTMNGNHNTLEAHVKADYDRLENFDKSNPEVLSRLETLYDKHASEDLKPVLDNFEAAKGKAKSANFYKAKDRLDNDDMASLLLQKQLTDEKTDITKMDIAIAWYMQKVTAEVEKKYGTGSTKANLTNISNQVTRYMGTIDGTTKVSESEIDSQMKKVEAEIQKFLASSVEQIKKSLVDCFDNSSKWKGQCELSTAHLNDELSDLLYVLNDISAEMGVKIAQAATRKDNVIMMEPVIIIGNAKQGLAGSGTGGTTGGNTIGAGPYTPASKPVTTLNMTPAQVVVAQKSCEEKIIKKKSLTVGLKTDAIEKAKKFLVLIKDIESLLKAKKAGHKDMDKEKEVELKYEGINYNLCCNGAEEDAFEEAYTLAFFYTMELKFFYGIPHGAEIGIKGAVELGAEGQLSFKTATCEASKCGAIGIRMHPSLSVYAEVASGLVAVEGGIKWEPKLELEQCKASPMPPATFNFNVGLIVLYYQATYGWAVTVDDQLPINHVFGLNQSQGIEKKIQIF